jgi:hypothetical protein|tara:strand:+ start:3060 stop:3263 length:204 start_codon:yes stop_codon:yes gene_type:complete
MFTNDAGLPAIVPAVVRVGGDLKSERSLKFFEFSQKKIGLRTVFGIDPRASSHQPLARPWGALFLLI